MDAIEAIRSGLTPKKRSMYLRPLLGLRKDFVQSYEQCLPSLKKWLLKLTRESLLEIIERNGETKYVRSKIKEVRSPDKLGEACIEIAHSLDVKSHAREALGSLDAEADEIVGSELQGLEERAYALPIRVLSRLFDPTVSLYEKVMVLSGSEHDDYYPRLRRLSSMGQAAFSDGIGRLLSPVWDTRRMEVVNHATRLATSGAGLFTDIEMEEFNRLFGLAEECGFDDLLMSSVRQAEILTMVTLAQRPMADFFSAVERMAKSTRYPSVVLKFQTVPTGGTWSSFDDGLKLHRVLLSAYNFGYDRWRQLNLDGVGHADDFRKALMSLGDAMDSYRTKMRRREWVETLTPTERFEWLLKGR